MINATGRRFRSRVVVVPIIPDARGVAVVSELPRVPRLEMERAGVLFDMAKDVEVDDITSFG